MGDGHRHVRKVAEHAVGQRAAWNVVRWLGQAECVGSTVGAVDTSWQADGRLEGGV